MAQLTKSQWFIGIVAGLIVAAIVAVVGYVFAPLAPNVPVIGANPATAPKTKIEVRANSFELPDVHRGFGFFVQLERELTLKYISENKMGEQDAKRAALKEMSRLYEVKLLSDIFKVAGASGYNKVFIENVGSASDKNVVLTIDGIRFVTGIERDHPNVQWEKDVIKIIVIRPGDKIYLDVWTRGTLFGAKPDQLRASSDAGSIAVSVR